MSRVTHLILSFTFALCIWAIPAAAQEDDLLFPEPQACVEQPDDPTILPEDKTKWNNCEKWAWSCLRQGLEANLYSKNACAVPRTMDSVVMRRRMRLAPFYKPERYAETNALSGDFIVSVITNPHYYAHLGTIGVRIFGGYFADPINLENYTTNLNIVLDGSVMRHGVRLTNFKTDKNLSFDGSNVHGSIYLMRSRIQGSLFMEAGVYDYVDLNDAKIGASFEGSSSVFNDEIRIYRAEVDGKVILTKSRLTTLSGWNALLGSSLDMRLADVRFGVDLTGSHVKGDVRMQDVTFGRHKSSTSPYCDWNPDLQIQNVLHELRQAVPKEDFDAVYREVVIDRPSKAAGVQPNVCETASSTEGTDINVLSDRNSVLLRDMKIDGSLCLVDVNGEIALGDTQERRANIGKIAIDGTSANSTILSWHTASPSSTLWYVTNFKTNYLLANLENAPLVHYTDNIDVGSVTVLRRAAIYAASEGRGIDRADEYRVREKCDVTPGVNNNERISDRNVQNRIINFFNADKSESPQPFANIVSRIDATGINTTHLKIALSERKNRNACSSSQLMRHWNELPWASVGDRLAQISLDEARKFALDGFCTAGLLGLKYSVSYGHEPHNLIFIAFGLVLFFALLLRFDKPTSGFYPGEPLGLTYALDTLNPLKPYRIDRRRAEEKPNRRSLRIYLAFHKIMGATLAIVAFFFVYKASQ